MLAGDDDAHHLALIDEQPNHGLFQRCVGVVRERGQAVPPSLFQSPMQLVASFQGTYSSNRALDHMEDAGLEIQFLKTRAQL